MAPRCCHLLCSSAPRQRRWGLDLSAIILNTANTLHSPSTCLISPASYLIPVQLARLFSPACHIRLIPARPAIKYAWPAINTAQLGIKSSPAQYHPPPGQPMIL